MRVSACCGARRDLYDPNMHIAVLKIVQLGLEKIRSLYGLLLGADELTSEETWRSSSQQRQDNQPGSLPHGNLHCSARSLSRRQTSACTSQGQSRLWATPDIRCRHDYPLTARFYARLALLR